MKCTATCAFGLESVLNKELKNMGFKDIQSENGRINFESDLYGVACANINLRTAERVYIELKFFYSKDFDTYFDNIKTINFHDFIDKKGRIEVAVTSLNSKLQSIPACQSVAKKAIVESMTKHFKLKRLDETGPTYQISIFIYKDKVRVYLDTSGVSLYKRGYRAISGQAPLKETLASALVQISYWNKEKILLDPFCGSGTILIEAALIANNIAPGLYRNFLSESWPIFGNSLWDKARDFYQEAIESGPVAEIIGYDIDKEIIAIAKSNAKRAKVDHLIDFRVGDFKDIEVPYEKGIIICNPPYGERLENVFLANKLYEDIYLKFKEFPKWSKYIFAPDGVFEEGYKDKPDKKRKLYNGRILCYYYQYFGEK